MDDSHHLLRDYLQTRRAKILPGDVGLIGGGLRRVAGLRREEVASLAGVNVDYYARLEQGRLQNVSIAVLNAVARALRLDPAERQHLIDLARPSTGRKIPELQQRVRPAVQTMLNSLDTQPAFVMGHGMDILAANDMAHQVMGGWMDRPTNQRNLARFIFLDPEARTIHSDWAVIAEEAVATLRHDAGRHQDDPQLNELVRDLTEQSPEFARWWAGHDVRSRSNGTKTYRHPQMGDITVHCEALDIPGDNQRLCIYTADPGTPSHQALTLLAALRRPEATAGKDPARLS